MCEYSKIKYVISVIRTIFYNKILTGKEKENVK